MFSTREAFEERLSILIKKWRQEFQFKCFACKNLFSSPEELRDHNTTWCQMQNSHNFNWTSQLFEASSTIPHQVGDSQSDLTQKETYEKGCINFTPTEIEIGVF